VGDDGRQGADSVRNRQNLRHVLSGCLLVFVSAAQVWTTAADHLQQEPIYGPVSQLWMVAEFADERAAQGHTYYPRVPELSS
jgi:hypothetical protein